MNVKDLPTRKLKRYYFRWLKRTWKWQSKPAARLYTGPASDWSGASFRAYKQPSLHADHSFRYAYEAKVELEHRGYRFK